MKALQFCVTVPQFAALKVLGRLRRQLYYRGPLATVRLADMPEPRLPSPDWVKIRTFVCGFCGSDINLIMLRDSPTATPFTSFPCTIGHELCGEVLEIGEGVKDTQVGDVVTIAPSLGCAARGIDPECRACGIGRPGSCENFAEGNLSPGMFTGICRDVGGGFAPYVVAHGEQVFRLPGGVSHNAGAMMEPLAVVLQALQDNMPEVDDQVLVVGGGVIGSLFVQVMRALDLGCEIAVAEPSPFHADLIAGAGADYLITDGDILGHAARITGGRAYKPMIGKRILMGGFSRIYDTVASAETLDTSLRSLRIRGVLSIVGIGKETMSDLTPLWLKLQTIKGVYCYGYEDVDGRRRHMFERAIDLARQRKVDLDSMVTHTFSLEGYREMIEVNLSKGKNRALKTVVSFE